MFRFEQAERRFKQRVEPIAEPYDKDRLLLDPALEDLGGCGFAALEQALIRFMVPSKPYNSPPAR